VAERTVAEGGSLVILPDAMGLDPQRLLAGVRETLGFVPVVGAVAAGMPLFELYGAAVARGAMAAFAVAGAAPIIGVAQGCLPIGRPYVITGAEGNVIRELGSRPPVMILREAIASLENGEERIRRAGIFAGLAMDPAKSPLERGDFLVRNLLGLDQSSGAIAVGEAVKVGQTMQFQLRDRAASHEDLRSTLAEVAGRLRGRPPAFGCYFNCAGRGAGLFGVPDHDVTLIRQHLGEFPLVGFFGNGEFAPIGRRNFFHTYTGALAVFPAS
jgi:small ligand-binding sensory domain FIST